VRKPIIAVLADHAQAHSLRAQGLSWTEVFERFAGNPTISLTKEQAKEWEKNSLAEWAGRGRLLITARREAFAKLRDLSTKVGDYVTDNRREQWIGPYLREVLSKTRNARR